MIVETISRYFLKLQEELCQQFGEECEEGASAFVEDHWSNNSGGGGISRILKKGTIIEQAGINFSHVFGSALPSSASAKRPELSNLPFQAMGVSLVIHPRNPYVPTTHFNLRFIICFKDNFPFCWWFGGGFDLTPYYFFDEDCLHWHRMAKEACDPFGVDLYPRFKKECDAYFYLKHRQEPRGIGGIFFDDLNQWSLEHSLGFAKSIGEHFIKAYRPILAKRKNMLYSERERQFQCYRRGRYVEFNLLYDRGTLFGLQSGGRTESILMSLPPEVYWEYDWHPEPNSIEAQLVPDFKYWASLIPFERDNVCTAPHL